VYCFVDHCFFFFIWLLYYMSFFDLRLPINPIFLIKIAFLTYIFWYKRRWNKGLNSFYILYCCNCPFKCMCMYIKFERHYSGCVHSYENIFEKISNIPLKYYWKEPGCSDCGDESASFSWRLQKQQVNRILT